MRNLGINIPVIPGIMPVRSLKQINKMTLLARITLPKRLLQALEKFPTDTLKIGTEFAIQQCQDLIDFGVTGLHFYTLNHSDQTAEILENIL